MRKTAICVLSLLTCVSMTACSRRQDTVVDDTPTAQTFLNTYGEDTNVRVSTALSETVTLVNTNTNSSVAVPVSYDISYAETEDEDTGNRSLYGTVGKTIVNAGVTENYTDEFYADLELKNNNKFGRTVYYNETQTITDGQDTITNQIFDWTRSGNYKPLEASLMLNRFDPSLFVNASYTENLESAKAYTIIVPLLDILDEWDIRDLILASGIEGLEIKSVDMPPAEDSDENLTDYDIALKDAEIVYIFDTDGCIASITADDISVNVVVSLNGTAMNANITISLGTTFSDHSKVSYTETVIPNTVKAQTDVSTNIGDLFNNSDESTEESDEEAAESENGETDENAEAAGDASQETETQVEGTLTDPNIMGAETGETTQ